MLTDQQTKLSLAGKLLHIKRSRTAIENYIGIQGQAHLGLCGYRRDDMENLIALVFGSPSEYCDEVWYGKLKRCRSTKW